MAAREWRLRLGLVALGIVAGVLLLEAGLQAAAWLVRPEDRAGLPSRAPGALRVLCIGDSNTYGLWLAREEAWPARLQARWNAQPDAAPIEVVNVGVPGANTSRVLRDLSPILEATEPDLVLAMLGVNDYWTRPVPPAEAATGDAAAAPAGPWLLRHTILYELFRLAWRSRDPRARAVEVLLHEADTPARRAGEGVVRIGELELDAGFEQGLSPEERGDSESLVANLVTLTDRLRAEAVPVYLLTYPARWEFYAVANPQIRRAAARSGTPLVDLEPLFAERCTASPCPAWFFDDHHPKAPGYDLVARALVARLRRDGW
jgi:lysophospholipase L1-like esterase